MLLLPIPPSLPHPWQPPRLFNCLYSFAFPMRSYRFYFLKTFFFQPFKQIKNILITWVVQKLAAGYSVPTLIQSIESSPMSPIVPRMPLIGKHNQLSGWGSKPGSFAAFSCHIAFVSFNLVQFFLLSFRIYTVEAVIL